MIALRDPAMLPGLANAGWPIAQGLNLANDTPMLVLGIETTCDETAAAVVERRERRQRPDPVQHRALADRGARAASAAWCRRSRRAPMSTCSTASSTARCSEAGVGFAQLSAVAAAAGPGLIGGVIVGLTTAKAIALVHDTPLIAVNHLEAHALTPRLTDALAFPYCLFLASGGHTQIVAVLGVGNYVRLGTTVDDAMGEAFDKVAKMLGAALSGRPAGRARGGERRRRAVRLSAADARARRTPISRCRD